MPSTSINYSTTTPSAPAGQLNVHWQGDNGNPRNVSAYVPVSGLVAAHASRPAPASYAEGTLLFESDRRVLYIRSGAAWQYAGGAQIATLSARPTDLTSNDRGYLFLDAGASTMYAWSGSAWLQMAGGSTATGASVWGPSQGAFVWGPATSGQNPLIWQTDPPAAPVVWG